MLTISVAVAYKTLPLEFTNTVDWHASDQPIERLQTFTDLVAWALENSLISGQQSKILLEEADLHSAAAAQALQNAQTLRETIYRILLAVISGDPPSPTDITHLNQTISISIQELQLMAGEIGFSWDWDRRQTDLNFLLGPIAITTAALLTAEDVEHIGICADDRGCGYLFLDTSKNQSRRWCSMGNCGNRAKQRRFYQRSKLSDG